MALEEATAGESARRRAGEEASGGLPLTEEAARAFADRWQIAWNSHSAEEVAALCTEDVVWDDPLTERPERGKDAVAAYLESVWRTFPDLEFTWPEEPYCSFGQTKLACHWRVTGTMTGPIEPQGFAPTGRPLEAEGVDLLELRDGLVCSYVGFFDARGMAQQIGVMPGPGSRAERIAVRLQRLGAKLGRRR